MKPLHIKLADFGSARIKSNKQTGSVTNPQTGGFDNPGTPYYQAPEVLIDGKRAQPYSYVWSACLLSTEWFTGKQSWPATGPNAYWPMKQRHMMPSQLSDVPSLLREVLESGLNYSVELRPTAEKMEKDLSSLAHTGRFKCL